MPKCNRRGSKHQKRPFHELTPLYPTFGRFMFLHWLNIKNSRHNNGYLGPNLKQDRNPSFIFGTLVPLQHARELVNEVLSLPCLCTFSKCQYAIHFTHLLLQQLRNLKSFYGTKFVQLHRSITGGENQSFLILGYDPAGTAILFW